MRVLFLCSPSRAYGEINSILPLARGVAASGGEVWFLTSPLAGEIARCHFPDRVFELTPALMANQSLFRRIVKKFRPDVIVLSELYEILQPRRKPECPLIDYWWLRETQDLDCSLIFMDFIAHVPMLRSIAECDLCASHFGAEALRSFLERLWVILPCPLNEPSAPRGRRGIPYRAQSLPLTVSPERRCAIRTRFLGASAAEDGILVLRTGSTWQSLLAEQNENPLYRYLGDLLASYLGGLAGTVSLVSVSSRHKLTTTSKELQVHNVSNLPPDEFEDLALSSDLVITDNEIGYTLAKTLGKVPGIVLVNSFTMDDILAREKRGSRVRQIAQAMERDRPHSVFPHKIFPLPALSEEFHDDEYFESTSEFNASEPASCAVSTIRLGRMMSSPFVRAELFGGEDTRAVFQSVLCDTTVRREIRHHENTFIERLQQLDDGVGVLMQLALQSSLANHTAL